MATIASCLNNQTKKDRHEAGLFICVMIRTHNQNLLSKFTRRTLQTGQAHIAPFINDPPAIIDNQPRVKPIFYDPGQKVFLDLFIGAVIGIFGTQIHAIKRDIMRTQPRF